MYVCVYICIYKYADSYKFIQDPHPEQDPDPDPDPGSDPKLSEKIRKKSFRIHNTATKHENSVLFLFLWVIFALLDPDPDLATQINADPQPCGKPGLWIRIRINLRCWIRMTRRAKMTHKNRKK